MKPNYGRRLFGLLYDNRKSKTCTERSRSIQNQKWVGIVAVSAAIVVFGEMASAQQPTKVPRIGYLSARDQASDFARSEAVRQGLRELGYIEGQNITIEYRYAGGKRERFPELATELVRLKVDLIVAAGGDLLLRAVIDATRTIPIIMTGGGVDPVKAGFVESLARPGGNVTGITNLVFDLGAKRLELLKEAVPKIGRVAVLHDASSPNTGLELKEILPGAARELKLAIHLSEVRGMDDIETVLATMGKQRPDGLYVSTGALLNSNRKRIVGFALMNRLPSVYGRSEYVAEGGLLYYGADIGDSYRRVAYYVDKILKGANPAELPVEQPTKFELVINLKTARQIGVTIPDAVLFRANRVIR